jgi:hypothetical protein
MISVNLNTRSWKHLIWILDLCILLFALPLLFVNLLDMPIDLYYLVFLLSTAGLIIYYKKSSSLKARASLKSGWALGFVLALFFGLGFISYSLVDSPGLLASFRSVGFAAILWRGIVFGVASGIMISVFPFVVTWRALAGTNPGNFRRIGVVAAAVFFVALTSVSYTMGLTGQGRDNLRDRITTNLIASVPTLVSGNPMAAPIAGAFKEISEMVKTQNGKPSARTDNVQAARNQKKSGGSN